MVTQKTTNPSSEIYNQATQAIHQRVSGYSTVSCYRKRALPDDNAGFILYQSSCLPRIDSPAFSFFFVKADSLCPF